MLVLTDYSVNLLGAGEAISFAHYVVGHRFDPTPALRAPTSTTRAEPGTVEP